MDGAPFISSVDASRDRRSCCAKSFASSDLRAGRVDLGAGLDHFDQHLADLDELDISSESFEASEATFWAASTAPARASRVAAETWRQCPTQNEKAALAMPCRRALLLLLPFFHAGLNLTAGIFDALLLTFDRRPEPFGYVLR